MASRDPNPPPAAFTTNEEDQREAARLQARLRNHKSTFGTGRRLPSVEIADGAHKYVLLKATPFDGGDEQYIVTSRRGAAYHRNAAEPMIERLEASGYSDIQVTGGGRIFFDPEKKKISIFGFSYSFGLANHSISREVVLEDPRYKDFDVTISNEGY